MRGALTFCFILVICSRVSSQTHRTSEFDTPSTRSLSTQAAVKIKDGQLLDGAAVLKEAITLHKGGILRSSRLPFEIDQSDREWGRAQVERLLTDRPRLAEIVQEEDPLWDFLCAAFGGAYTSARVSWDPTSPDGANASHDIPRRNRLGRVRVALRNMDTQGAELREMSAEEILAGICFEIHNMARYELQLVLSSMAMKGQISKEVYIQEMFLCEFHALEDTRAFYANVVLPQFHKQEIKTDPHNWYVEGWWFSDSQARRLALQSKDKYPWVPYAAYYDYLNKGIPLEEALRTEDE